MRFDAHRRAAGKTFALARKLQTLGVKMSYDTADVELEIDAAGQRRLARTLPLTSSARLYIAPHDSHDQD